MTDEDHFHRLLEQMDRPYHRGWMAGATHAGEVTNPSCGDQVRLEIGVDADAGRVAEAWFTGRGCVSSQASASLLVRHIEGKPLANLTACREPDMLHRVGIGPTRTIET